jgi:hypothetical protein
MADTTISAPNKRELTIHYLRPGFKIPQPDQVEKRKKRLGAGYGTMTHNWAFKLSPTLAVKYGVRVKLLEAQNMLFIEQHTTIPVPKVHAVYSCKVLDKSGNPPPPASKQDDDQVCTYIFMDLVAGSSIDEIWDKWDDATRLNLQNELKDYVRQLRDIPSEGYIGSLNRGPIVDRVLRYYSTDFGTMASSKSLSINLLANVPPSQVHLTAKRISTWRSAKLTSRRSLRKFASPNAWMPYLAPTSII